jgi:hypothetical protein
LKAHGGVTMRHIPKLCGISNRELKGAFFFLRNSSSAFSSASQIEN